jgi:hypothetical protein
MREKQVNVSESGKEQNERHLIRVVRTDLSKEMKSRLSTK